jgi:pimeloyl-ACP methyl ester carboxylesterase
VSAGERLAGTPEPMHLWEGVGGVRIAGDSWGNPHGTLVMLLHGGGQTRHAWKNTGKILGAAGYHAVAFDARGHGDSDWDADGLYSQDAMVGDLKCLVSALGDSDPVLVGASMGGGTSLVAVGENHVDAAALVMVDAAPTLEMEGVEKIRTFMSRRPDGFLSLQEVADAIAAYQPHRTRPKDLGGLAKNVRLGSDGRFRWHWDPRIRSVRHDFIKRYQQLMDCASRIRVPTLLVRGALSDVVSEEGAIEFLKACPHSRYMRVTEAGHMLAGDQNDIFGSAVVEFLSKAVPAR